MSVLYDVGSWTCKASEILQANFDLSRAYLGFEYIWIAIKGYFSA